MSTRDFTVQEVRTAVLYLTSTVTALIISVKYMRFFILLSVLTVKARRLAHIE